MLWKFFDKLNKNVMCKCLAMEIHIWKANFSSEQTLGIGILNGSGAIYV